MKIYHFPLEDSKYKIPKKLIHGTTSFGLLAISDKGIKSRGYSPLGIQNPPSSLDFGEGFYCSLDNQVCRRQVETRAKTKAESFNIDGISPIIIEVLVDKEIHTDQSLKCVYFDGRLEVDGLEWAEYIAFHRVKKDKKLCTIHPCENHPDIIIGPVADGKSVSKYAHDVYKGLLSIEEYYSIITKSSWFPEYKQYVFSDHAIKYLSPVLKL
ncbi:uncharacterized protein DUF3990 [Bacillus sp. V-88]|nr:hypothetical protein B1B00_14350 [Bacillus sp. DSM 27956]PRX75227.1 uncharacterized protein DUF3990 [Bacillus sp. V-88]SLK23678.1 Protein of unknown function [Bacillus sp. V-88]